MVAIVLCVFLSLQSALAGGFMQPDTFLLHGTVTVGEHVPAKGWIELRLGLMGGSVVARVEGGRWLANIPSGDEVLAVMRMHLDDREAHAAPSHFLLEDYRSGSEYVIHARFTPHTTLHVHDAGTGADLRDVELVVESPWDQRTGEPPIRDATLRQAPIRLDPWEDNDLEWLPRRRWWVRAPGHAWKRLEVDHGAGGQVHVRLDPYGSLRVDWRGGRAIDAIHVRPRGLPLRPGDFQLWNSEPVTFEDLAPGEYDVEARSRSMRWSGRAIIHPGQTSEIVLDPDRRVAP